MPRGGSHPRPATLSDLTLSLALLSWEKLVATWKDPLPIRRIYPGGAGCSGFITTSEVLMLGPLGVLIRGVHPAGILFRAHPKAGSHRTTTTPELR